MNKIEFTAIVGVESRSVEISKPHGAAGIFYVMVDKYFIGQMMKVNGEWRGHFNGSDITGDDVYIGEIIERELYHS